MDGEPPLRALLSVYDKHGIVDFARKLAEVGWEIVSTGGTLAELNRAGVPAISVSDVTGHAEILDGRVKTLHPAIHGGLLAKLSNSDHVKTLAEYDIAPIALLAVNLYPFEATIQQPGVTDEDAIEQIDIGGPAMLRAAAKNHADVIVVSNPSDYDRVLDGLRGNSVTATLRRNLAAKAFAHVAAYDTLVASYLAQSVSDETDGEGWPLELSFAGRRVQTLRYGENPSQRAAAYRRLTSGPETTGVLNAKQLGGKELSFNNLLDADAAWNAILGLHDPSVAIVKHTIPCGLASSADLVVAYEAALAGDPVSAFGGIVALNRPVDLRTAEQLAEMFFEVIIAPGFDESALTHLQRKKQLRLLTMPTESLDAPAAPALDVRPILGGLLVQTSDHVPTDTRKWRVMTERQPSESELRDLAFAWHAVRHVKSNAIVMAKDWAVVGVGSGQPNRLESVRIAASKAGERGKNAALASDAFFPFADGVQAAIDAGVSAVVQPGGSIRDEEVIEAANRAGITMLFTGVRHFRH